MSTSIRFTPCPLHVENVTLRYSSRALALDQISLTAEPGEVLGLVGPNGAGKSTLLKVMAGLLPPDSGTVRCGDEITTRKTRRTAHYLTLMPDPLGVYNDINAQEYLDFFGRAFGLKGAEAEQRKNLAIERLGLAPWLTHEVESLSAGWQRRLALSRVLLANTPIVLLDEPAAGLDVSARLELLQIVRSFSAEGRTVLVTSHILPELEELADRFAILQKGRWVSIREGVTFFKRKDMDHQQGFWWVELSDLASALNLIGPDLLIPEPGSRRLKLMVSDENLAAEHLANLVHHGIKIYRFEPQTITLSEITQKALGQVRSEKKS